MQDSVIVYRDSLQPFSAACGNRPSLELAVSHRDRHSTIDLHSIQKPFVRIGRSIRNDLVLHDKAVSFRHMYLQLVDERWIYFDLRSTVRSKGGRRQAPIWGWLEQAQEMQVGPYSVCARTAEVSEQTSSSPRHGGAMPEAVAEFELELLNRPNYPMRRIRRSISLIGSSRDCDLRLNDSSVSSVHASLVLTPRGVWIVDLLGRNGISVNRQRVSWKQLQNGSFLEIGRFCFRVWINNAKPMTLDKAARSMARPAPADATPRHGAIDGSLTREFVMGVLDHLVDSRTEFFEHLKQQSQLIHQLFEQLNETRPAHLLGDLQRIERLDRELVDLKQQLARLEVAYESRISESDIEPDIAQIADNLTSRATAKDRLATASNEPSGRDNSQAAFGPVRPRDVQGPVVAVEIDRGAQRQLNVDLDSSPPIKPDISVEETHALLSQRMSRLARQRSSLFQSLLRHLRLA